MTEAFYHHTDAYIEQNLRKSQEAIQELCGRDVDLQELTILCKHANSWVWLACMGDEELYSEYRYNIVPHTTEEGRPTFIVINGDLPDTEPEIEDL